MRNLLMRKKYFGHGSVFLLQGSSFPEPLSESDERYYLRKMSEGEEDARNILIEHNLRLVAHIVKKYQAAGENDDLISIGTIGLIKAICAAVEKAGFKMEDDFKIALDPASTEMYEAAKKEKKEGSYYFWKQGNFLTQEEMISFWEDWTRRYPICSIEDAMSEEDWDGWKSITAKLGGKIQLVGDDLFVTNSKRLQKGIDEKAANAILVKVNQIGTLTESLDAIELAKRSSYNTIISHRSGETEDTTIADIAVAVNSGQIKTGAPSRTDRTSKYNRLLRIEEELGKGF